MAKAINLMNLILKHVLNLVFAVLTTAVFTQVIFRFVLKKPLAWTEELAIYCLVWLTFLGAAYALSQRAHIGVDFFIQLFPLAVRKVIYTVATFISLVFYLIMVSYGYRLMIQGFAQTSSVFKIPMGAVYSVIPISGIILIINLIFIFIQDIKSEGETI
ncbi:MAG TPA: TRAP transporter small permease [Pseudogracilibacillus sp.]|nr:TRAP transporter small permease [Pseudogracilibacillus sp.]